ncbi:SpvB/TcaC N-terminal domain-containing protein [Chryseobacterium sp. G0240]|uniref:SpvB/TcaC N-terminal domain-containing protein n=1 Tax=Chryseobacterium sp. G0240 TaxID=2487066 RepID=UPI0016183A99|nr:SpvB/TcaC N-terminal domain-containing protein [Chryseobacterium sp. G0240]
MRSFSLFILSLCSVMGFSQTILYQAESTARTVQDPLTVVMAPGFNVKSTVSNPFVATIGPDTQNQGGGPVNSNAGANNPSHTTEVSGNRFHDTKGNIEVTGAGQLQFTLPIALPPGVKSVAPQIDLIYVSSSGNGIAGYGWNMSGITAISRSGKTIEKDGAIGVVQLDYSDYYSFSGQRLILKSGEYGKDGAEYVTEKYSNVKIKSIGSISGKAWKGPEYWEVTFEDGSQSWYGASGNSQARTPLEYNIVKWKDKKGNYITYNYIQNDNVSVISSIEWGGNEVLNKPHFNKINFTYNPRMLVETSYVNGQQFIQGKLLSEIAVYTGSTLFKKYLLTYSNDPGISKYEFLEKVTEATIDNSTPGNYKYANPVIFNKPSINAIANKQNLSANLISQEQKLGDFDGDGRADLLYYSTGSSGYYECLETDDYGNCQTQGNYIDGTSPGTYVIFNKLSGGSAPVKVSDENLSEGVIAGGILDGENKISNSQGIITYKEEGTLPNKKLIFKAYILKNNVFTLVKQKEILSSIYDRTGTYPPNPKQFQGYQDVSSFLGTFKEVDTNGDGISELAFSIEHKRCTTTFTYTGGGHAQIPVSETLCDEYYRNYLFDLFSDNNPNQLIELNIGKSLSAIDVLDINGDGRTDFIDRLNGYFFILEKGGSLNNTAAGALVNFNGENEGFVYGDFNGDGKMDFAVPEKDVEETSNWRLYINQGNDTFKEQYVSNLSVYRKKPYESNSGRKRQIIYTTLVKDVNGDGKADFINLKSETFRKHDLGANRDSSFNFRVLANEGSDISGNIVFKERYTNSEESTIEDHFIPINISARINNIDRFVMVKHGNYSLFTFDYFNLPQMHRVNSIKQGVILTSVSYNDLDSGNSNTSSFYQSSNNLIYPYSVINNLPSTSVVTQLRQADKKQDFRYTDLVAHLQGKGMIGFRQVARSSWYNDTVVNSKIWSGAEMDPLKEGLPVKEWAIRTVNTGDAIPNDISENNTQLLSFKSTSYKIDKLLNGQVVTNIQAGDKAKIVTAIVPESTKSKDFLTNTVTSNTVTYGDYYFPVQATTSVNGNYATTLSSFEYIHNPSGIGANYFIGRPKSKTESIQAYGDTKSSKEEYSYENNLLKTLKTWNRDNTGYLSETYDYDGFGNITNKLISNSADAETQTTSTQYDPKGRFVIKKTDNLGLQTHIEYNDLGQIIAQTDPLGNTLNNTYDEWGKLMRSKTNLGGVTTYVYIREDNNKTNVTEYSPDGNQKTTYVDELGQTYRTSIKGFEKDKYIKQDFVYDILGRKTGESEPYSGPNATQWNTITYDDSVFPAKVKTQTFNGKKAVTSVSGNITKVEELTGNMRITTKETDALGNVIATTDKGGTIQFSYNAAGDQIKAKYAENTVTTKYDAWGRKSEFNDPSNGTYTYEYTGFGQTKKIISPKGTKEYSYNNLGQLISQKEISTVDAGKATNKLITYSYDNKGRVIAKSGTSKGKTYASNILYDPQGRVLSSSESSNDKYFIQKGITYDDKARVISYERQLYSSGVLTKVNIENLYSAWDGSLYQVKDKNSGKILWQLDGTNEKGQVLRAKLGAINITNDYDLNTGALKEIKHSSAAKPSLLHVQYQFDVIRNELKSRTTGGDFNIIESFDYDDNNRLINWTNPVTGVKPQSNRSVYDAKGRILENDQVGTIKFENSAKIYQPTGMTLNAAGTQNYNNDLIQSITYNENNDPVFIDGEKGDVAFQYGLTSMRQRVTYGGNFNADSEGKFTKFYSEDGSFEIVKDNTTGKEKHILYIGGTPYESNIVFLKNYTEDTGSYKFLHKDYLGSILAITDEAGNKLEQRHFDAWGNMTHLQIGNGAVETNADKIKEIVNAGGLLLERGYTSHEHFMEVGIIHMNGRLYDPLLRRFLNADENIQEPYNTQNYNKYGYVLNNPLMYNDPSGELFGLGEFLSAVVIAAIIGAVTYSAGVLISGAYWNFGDFLKATVFGAISGAVTFGIGSIFTPAMEVAKAATGMTGFLMEAGVSIAQAGVHGYVQGILSLAQGGTFEQAFIAGALGSLGASAFKMTAGSFSDSTVGTVLFGAVSGGVGSQLSGGNFWEGVVIGGMVAGLNHAMHSEEMETESTVSEDGSCPTCPKNAKNGDMYTEKPFSILEKDTWGNFGESKTYIYFGGEWSEMKYITGDVPLGPGGVFKGPGLLKKLPSIDVTGKVHGALPRVKDLANFSKGSIKILLKDLKRSVPNRIRSTKLKGPKATKFQNKQHGERQAAEQNLIKSIEKILGL